MGTPTTGTGEELNYDFGFNNSQQNGNIAGMRWRSKGDGEQRAYGFGYDNVNRLMKGDFTQYATSAWNTSAGLDFSLKSMTYDHNGNINKMNQMGIKLTSSTLIDSLVYSYNTNSNKLNYVTDKVNDTTAHIGDFIEINNNTTQDYWYDGNGNLNKDNNKNITSITYNYLNLPTVITVAGKGTITYTYDASGNKLKKVTVDTTTNPDKTTMTDYLGGFVYLNDTLQFIGQEEGRARPKRANYSDTMFYDYFEKDHLGNVRVVLTDEKHQDSYPAATLENNTAALNTEKSYYAINLSDTISTSRIASWTTTSGNNYANNNGNPPYNNNPYANTTATSAIVYKLNGNTGNKTGLGITLRVMSGDIVDVFGKSFYHLNTGQTPVNTYPITSVLSAFINAFTGTSTISGAGKGATGAALNGSLPTTNGLNNWLGGVPNPSGNIPKAYINWILFDEQFKPVAGGSGFDLVNAIPDAVKSHHGTVNINRNGYLYVYCSNESNVDLFFDNLQVIHTRGPLLEETHYYPFGLTMSGISSKAAGELQNKYLYNGKEKQANEFSDGSGLELYDYGTRMQDPQLGRWHILDPKANLLEMSSPYVFCYNNPISYKDPDGELAILINGKVGSDAERGNASYWDEAVIDAIKSSGIPHRDNVTFIDGDRHRYNGGAEFGWGKFHPSVKNSAAGIFSNSPESRYDGGVDQGHRDFDKILAKLAKDPNSGKIIEKIQIYTHSRGAAFGAGYTAALLDEISKHADLFADSKNVIDFVYNMAPNESWGVSAPAGVDVYSDHHDKDVLSGNNVSGAKANFSSNQGNVWGGAHKNSSFLKGITAFTKAFVESKGDSKKLIDGFVKKMQQYGIKVTVHND